MAIGPIEKIVLDEHDPLLSRLRKAPAVGPVAMSSRPGKWLIDKVPVRDYFSGKYVLEARQIILSEQESAQAS